MDLPGPTPTSWETLEVRHPAIFPSVTANRGSSAGSRFNSSIFSAASLPARLHSLDRLESGLIRAKRTAVDTIDTATMLTLMNTRARESPLLLVDLRFEAGTAHSWGFGYSSF